MNGRNWVWMCTGLMLMVPSIRDSLAGETACQSASGSWQDPSTSGGWVVQQSSSPSVGGAYALSGYIIGKGAGCAAVQYPLTGGINTTTGAFTFTAVWPTNIAIRPDGCPASIFYNGTVLKPGCNAAAGAWGGNGVGGSFLVTKQCEKPIGEQAPRFVGWDVSGNRPAGASFNQSLLPSTTNFGGRVVGESSPTLGNDTCFFQGSIFPAFNLVSFSTWDVDAGNNYGPDTIDYPSGAVAYYRVKSRTPCGTTIPQTMNIDCNDKTTLTYATNALAYTIGDADVTVSKMNSSGTETANEKYGIAGSAYRASVVLQTVMLILLSR